MPVLAVGVSSPVRLQWSPRGPQLRTYTTPVDVVTRLRMTSLWSSANAIGHSHSSFGRSTITDRPRPWNAVRPGGSRESKGEDGEVWWEVYGCASGRYTGGLRVLTISDESVSSTEVYDLPRG